MVLTGASSVSSARLKVPRNELAGLAVVRMRIAVGWFMIGLAEGEAGQFGVT
jgi:hypothetical protein